MIRKRDGIHLDVGRRIVVDARSAVGDVTVVSHAHADHARSGGSAPVVCSRLTADLVRARSGVELDATESAEGVELLPSGHIVGSRAALIEADRRYLFTGDVSTRDRLYLEGFEPVDADVLVLETTYGRPDYRFPPQRELESRIVEWLRDRHDVPLVLYGYSLGRAQKIEHLVRRATDRRIVVHPTIRAVDAAIEAATDISFPGVSVDDVPALRPDDIVVAPRGAGRAAWLRRHVERYGALTAGFSGWAVDESYRYRAGVDEAFVLSDHCDFDELVALVRAVDPETVYTQHGFDAAFADYLATEEGYDAVPLLRDQTRLDEFAAASEG